MDTHNAFGTKMVKDTEIARKLYPKAIPINGDLIISIEDKVFTAPASGLYEVTTGVSEDYYTSNRHYLEKGDKKYFGAHENNFIHISWVRA